jgi:hypothetical protein
LFVLNAKNYLEHFQILINENQKVKTATKFLMVSKNSQLKITKCNFVGETLTPYRNKEIQNGGKIQNGEYFIKYY